MAKFSKIAGCVLYYGIGRWLPRPDCRIRALGYIAKRFRGFCGKLMLERCGKNVNICDHASFSTRVKLGNNSGIGRRANISGACTIGDNVIMGPEVCIFTMNHRTDRVDIPIKYQGNTEEREVFIGDDCWIGCRAMLLPGVKLGRGVVVGAGAVVSKDVPDYSVVVGNPARVVKTRGQ